MANAKKLPSGSWRVNQYIGKDENGKRIYKSFTAPTKKEAEFLAAEYVAKNRYCQKSMTVAEAIDRYIESKDGILSPTTINGYRNIRNNHLKGILNIKIDKITREEIQREINAESKKHSAKTVSNVHGLLAAAISMQNPDFILRTTLPRKVKEIKKDLPTSEEIARALRGTPAELPALCSMCLCLRLSEVRGIRKSAIEGDFLRIDQVIVTVRGEHIKKELAKTDATRRIVELPPVLKKRILACDGDYMTNMTGRMIYAHFVKAMKDAGLQGVRFHDLRHIAASDMHELGLSDRIAAERGGWSGTQTVQHVYQHTFSRDRVIAEKTMVDFYEKILSDVERKNDDATRNATHDA